jgi:hypothetical protein
MVNKQYSINRPTPLSNLKLARSNTKFLLLLVVILLYCSTVLLFTCSILTDCVGQNTPRGLEHKSVKNDSNITYNSVPAKGWPKSGPDPAKGTNFSSELQEIIDLWPSLPETIKQQILDTVRSAGEVND